MNLEEYKIELLSDFEELINFYTGKDKMDDFLHNHLQDCEESHYCKTFCVRLKANNTIVAIFALAFDSVDIDSDDFDDIYECMAVLMGMTWDIDARIEPHPILKEDYENISNPFVKEIIETGIKVA